jgi:hypothetical protein
MASTKTLQQVTFALSPEWVAKLAALSDAQRCGKVETIRRAISVLQWLTDEQDAGNAIATVTPDGTVTKTKIVGIK